MRAASTLVAERMRLGDREPILVNCFFIPGVLWRNHGRRSDTSPHGPEHGQSA